EEQLRGPYLAKRAAAEVAAGQTMDVATLHCYQGPVPGRRLDSLGRTRGRVEEVRLDLNRHLDEILGAEGHNFHFRSGPNLAPPRIDSEGASSLQIAGYLTSSSAL